MLVLARGLLPYPYQGPCQRQPASTKTWNRKHPAMNSDCSYKSILAIPFFRVLFQFPANIEIKWTKNLAIFGLSQSAPNHFAAKLSTMMEKRPKVGYLLFWKARITLSWRIVLCCALLCISDLRCIEAPRLRREHQGSCGDPAWLGWLGDMGGGTGGSRGTCGKAKKSASGTGDGNETHCKRNSLPVN